MLSAQLLELLRAWWREGRRRSLLLPGGWLFPGRNSVEPLSTRQLCRVVRGAAQAAGITKRVSPHTLRHSFATHLLEQDVDIRVIQTLLGHAKLDTTALYARVANSTIRAVTSPTRPARTGGRDPRPSRTACRNRHCPKCQGAAATDWLAAREADILPIGYFHVVFTLPAEIAPIAYQNKAVVYDLLFRTAAETLLTIAPTGQARVG